MPEFEVDDAHAYLPLECKTGDIQQEFLSFVVQVTGFMATTMSKGSTACMLRLNSDQGNLFWANWEGYATHKVIRCTELESRLQKQLISRLGPPLPSQRDSYLIQAYKLNGDYWVYVAWGKERKELTDEQLATINIRQAGTKRKFISFGLKQSSKLSSSSCSIM